MDVLNVIIIIISIIISVIIWYFICREMSYLAFDKGYPQRRYFHFCFWLGLIGFLMVIAAPDKKTREVQEELLAAVKAGNAPAEKPAEAPKPTPVAPKATPKSAPIAEEPANKTVSPLEAILSYALKFTTDEGLANYLTSQMEKSDGPTKKALSFIAAGSPAKMRQSASAMLEELGKK